MRTTCPITGRASLPTEQCPVPPERHVPQPWPSPPPIVLPGCAAPEEWRVQAKQGRGGRGESGLLPLNSDEGLQRITAAEKNNPKTMRLQPYPSSCANSNIGTSGERRATGQWHTATAAHCNHERAQSPLRSELHCHPAISSLNATGDTDIILHR